MIKRILAVVEADLRFLRRGGGISTSLAFYGLLLSRFLSNLSSAMPLICMPLFAGITLSILERRTADPALFYAHLPIRRRDVVIGHYLVAFSVAATVLLAALVTYFLEFIFEQQAKLNDGLYVLIPLLLVFEIIVALFFWLYFRYTSKKNISSLIKYSSIGVVVLMIVFDLLTGFISFAWENAVALTLRSPLLLFALFLVSFLLSVLSCRHSCAHYQKQDFEYLEPAIITPRVWGKVRTTRPLIITDGTIVMLERTRRYRGLDQGRILPQSRRKLRSPEELLAQVRLNEVKRLRRAAEEEAAQNATPRAWFSNQVLPAVLVIGLLILVIFILTRSSAQ